MYHYDIPDPQTPREQYRAAGHWLRLLYDAFGNFVGHERAGELREAKDQADIMHFCKRRLDPLPRRIVEAAKDSLIEYSLQQRGEIPLLERMRTPGTKPFV